MGKSDFTGMRKVTIRQARVGATPAVFASLTPDKIGADGIMIPMETNELTESTFAGDVLSDNGTNIGAGELTLMPKSIEDLKAVYPNGYDATTGSWAPPIGGCTLSDVTLAWEKVCDTKGNLLLKHCSIGLGFEYTNARDDGFAMTVTVYPSLSPGSEYGLTGALADETVPYMLYNGVYDPATDRVTFDTAAA